MFLAWATISKNDEINQDLCKIVDKALSKIQVFRNWISFLQLHWVIHYLVISYLFIKVGNWIAKINIYSSRRTNQLGLPVHKSIGYLKISPACQIWHGSNINILIGSYCC